MEQTNVTTGKVRLSYVHLFKPYASVQGQEEKFSCTILVPKTDIDTKARIDMAIDAAKQKGMSDKWGGVVPPLVPTPVYDGDSVRPSDGMAFGAECKGHWVFTASAKKDYPPEVVGPDRSPIINQSEIYSGVYAYVNVTFYPYTFGGKKGIGCGLGPVMKIADGESLGGSGVSAAKAFANVPTQQGNNANVGVPVQQSVQGYNPITGMPVQQQSYNPITGMPVQQSVQGYNPIIGRQVQQQSYNPITGMPIQQQAPRINPITGLPY